MNSLLRLGKVGGFTILAQPFGLIILGLLGLSWGSSGGILSGVLVAAALIGTILLHELGHAYMARRRGMWVRQIVLQAFGGVTMWQGRSTWQDKVWITAAGPAVNLILAAASYLLLPVVSAIPIAAQVLFAFYYINLLLGIFNLFPIVPLDGGMILHAVLNGKLGARFAPLAYAVGIGGSAVLVILGLLYQQIFVALFGGFFLYQNWQRWKAEGPRGGIGGLWEDWRASREKAWVRKNRAEVDKVLRRSLEEGIHKLSSREKDLLRRARKHDQWRN